MRLAAWAAMIAALPLVACGAPAEKAEEATPTQAASPQPKATPIAQPAAEQPVFLGDPCSAELYQDLIGRTETYARRANLPEGARVICHECARTEDHVPGRLNVQIGADGRVGELTCG